MPRFVHGKSPFPVEESREFTKMLNENTWGLSFTANFSTTEIEYLDLVVSTKDKFSTSTFFKKVDTNSYLAFDSGHYIKWKTNVPFGQYRRIRKNCSDDDMFIKQSQILKQRFQEKKYPTSLIKSAYKRAKGMTQKDCLVEKSLGDVQGPGKEKKTSPHFITTYNAKHSAIRKILNKYWFLLCKDPYLTSITTNPRITYRKPPSLKNIIAPSNVKNHQSTINKKEGLNNPVGSYRCRTPRCKCCNEIAHKVTQFYSNTTKEEFKIKFSLTCQSSYVIYLLECGCGYQYVGRTIQKLHSRINKHRNNIKKEFQLHSVSRHCSECHAKEQFPLTLIPIDHIPDNVQNRFNALKRREMYWIFKLATLKPKGLNETREIVT